MILDAFMPKARHFTVLTVVSLVGYAAAMVALYWQDGKNESTFKGLFRSHGLTVFLSVVLLTVGILLASLATYVLTAFARRRTSSLEGAIKYFLLGIFASAILIYGLAWVYGITGSTDLDQIALHLQGVIHGGASREPEVLFALLLVIVGLGFKIAAVPFHMWTPDAYDGAPTPITGFMSVGPKAAGFAAIIR